MEDVAREAGVSRALVSIAFRNAPGVSVRRRAEILAVADRLGYRPDRNASRLASRRTRALGLYLFNARYDILADVLDGLRTVTDEARYSVVIGISDGSGRRDIPVLQGLIDVRVDAIVLGGCLLPDAEIQRISAECPVIVATRDVPEVDSVCVDDHVGASMATRHLLGLGHRSVAMLVGRGASVQRVNGYQDTMRGAGLAPRIIETGWDQEDAMRTALGLLTSQERPSAIFCYNDVLAFGVMDALYARGERVAEDLSLVGYDNSRATRLPSVGLTTVDLKAEESGRRAAQLALKRIEHPDLGRQSDVLAPELIVRTSTAPFSI